MTLIAGFMREDCPILLGDLLISSSEKASTKLVIPTIGELSPEQFSQQNLKPSHLAQKLALLSPKLCVAWTGRLFDARTYLGTLVATGVHQHPSLDALRDIYNDLDDDKELTIIGFCRDGTVMHMFDFNAQQVPTIDKRFAYFKAAGYGYGGLLGALRDSEVTKASGTPNQLESGLATAMDIASSLISLEMSSAQPLQELYGAGYEIAHPLGHAIAKFADLVYLFWKVREVEPDKWGMNLAPFLAMKYSYQGDLLIIRSVRLSVPHEPFSTRVDSHEIHVIQPIYRRMEKKELLGYRPTSLNASFMCNVFFTRNRSGHTGVYKQLGRYSASSAPVVFRDEFTKGEGVDVNGRFIETTMKAIAKSMKKD